MIDLSIIIPCFNESASLPLLINTCKESICDKYNIEYVFVNNGSSDDSLLILNNLSFQNDKCLSKVVNVSINIGYGNGIIQGIKQSSGNIIAWTHADMQTHPKDVIEAFLLNYNSLSDNTTIVKGNRINRNIFDTAFTFGMTLFTSFILKIHLSDINAQPKIFNRKFFNDLRNIPKDFSIDLFLLYQAKMNGLKIITYPVLFNKRYGGESKGGGTLFGKYKLIKRTLKYILHLRKTI